MEKVGEKATEQAGMAGKKRETEITATIQASSETRTGMMMNGGHQTTVGEDHAEEIPKQAIQIQVWGLGNFQ